MNNTILLGININSIHLEILKDGREYTSDVMNIITIIATVGNNGKMAGSIYT